ncbi:MAG: hypothetical protein ED555_13490 [Allomuricauda sp.]|nr:MAG: hypothetical protein ED555_13490 [Allomuricauda sp.]
MATKTKNELEGYLEELKADFELYRIRMKGRIRNSYIKVGLGVLLVLALIAVSYLDASIFDAISGLKERLEFAAPIMGVPTSFTFASFNETKNLKKQMTGVYDFEDKVSEWEKGLSTYTKKDVLSLEHEFERFIR